MKRINKKLLIILIPIICFIVFLIFWGISLAKCEILTSIYWNEIIKLKNLEDMTLESYEYVKILSYSKTNIKVYCIYKWVVDKPYATIGETFTFIKSDEKWKCEKWNVVWSTSGTADNIIWPYWWHFVYFAWEN